jgi:chromosome segregation ATPase
LLSAQLHEYKNDRDGLEDSFKNEVVLLKNHLARKDSELQRALIKTDELDSRLKFDMKKIRIRERELENRLELIRAEKNAIVKNKDEQILDLRRKMDVLQMEVESYRQKCVDLNKSIEASQESFKRTTRALRLAMANLELQDENKMPLKKVD